MTFWERAVHSVYCASFVNIYQFVCSNKKGNGQELTQSDPTSHPQKQKGK